MASETDSTRVLRAQIAPLPDSDRRIKARAKITQSIRVRPSVPHSDDFDDVLVTLNVCRNGVYFSTERDSYYKGMRLFITFPYSNKQGSINQEYIGEVVRIDRQQDGRIGIAVHLLMSINLDTHPTYQR